MSIEVDTFFQMRHGRPKPPEINSQDYWGYVEKYPNVVTVEKDLGRWTVSSDKCGLLGAFPTHAEAIAWAMKEVGRG